MLRKISLSLVLLLALGFAAVAMAEAPPDADAQPVNLDRLLTPAQESCEAPAQTADNAVAGLENDLLNTAAAGEPCNQRVCGANQYCCNFSCSICAPIGGFCIQIFCG